MSYLKIATLRERGGLNKFPAAFWLAAFLLCFSFSGFAQQKQKEEADTLVRLMEANSAHLLEIDGVSYRKVVGPARFFHNNTYLLCDTALWNVNTNVIDAIGHVQIIQENTFLKSDRIEYLVNESLAKFRGGIVELFDKEGNILRTNYLDYNTRDSVAVFYNGGAMANPKGDLIESINGAYYSKEKLFSFTDRVNMFTDSVFIISNKIDYKTDLNKAFFQEQTTAWQQDNVLYTNSGEYDRPNDIFVFNKDSYILTREQEIWADLLTYFRKSGDADLYNNVQIVDTVQSTIALADKAIYRPAIHTVELTLKPAIGLYSVEKGVRDTLFMAGDSLLYYKKRYCDLDSSMISLAKERRRLVDIDPIAIAEAKVAAPGMDEGEQKRNQADKIRAGDPGNEVLPKRSGDSTKIGTLVIPADSLSTLRDSLSVVGKDSLQVAPLPPADTTLIQFIDAYHNVRIYRGDMQGLCDSLVYTGIDSIARFYKDPVLWSEVKNQFTADSIQVVLENNALSKANLLSNAFIISREDSVHFNQIKSPEMTAYFANNDLYRYDALGGVSAIFFLQEDSVVTVMNQKESKMLSVKIKDRQVQRLKYIEQIKNDAHPIFNLPMDQQKLRGFNWRAQERPLDRNSVTDRKIKSSDRTGIEAVPMPGYEYAKVYFPQRRDSIMAYKQELDSVKLARLRQLEAERLRKAEERERAQMDSLGTASRADTLIKDEMPADSLSKGPNVISTDSVSVQNPEMKPLTKKEKKKAEKQLRREKKRLEREKRVEIRKQKRYFSKNISPEAEKNPG